MHLFTRTRTMDTAKAPEALAFSVDIAQYVSSVTGLDVIPWASVYGAPGRLTPLGLIAAAVFLARGWRRGDILVIVTLAGFVPCAVSAVMITFRSG